MNKNCVLNSILSAQFLCIGQKMFKAKLMNVSEIRLVSYLLAHNPVFDSFVFAHRLLSQHFTKLS